MKRTFTFLVSLFLMVGTMWADFTQSYDTSAALWSDWSAALPDGLQAVVTEHGNDGTVKYGVNEVVVSAEGDIKVKFQYGGGQPHKIVILGVELLAGESVVKSDYHVGESGGNNKNNTYTLSGATAGEYTIRYFVCNKPGDHALNSTAGTITFSGNITEKTFEVEPISTEYCYQLKNVAYSTILASDGSYVTVSPKADASDYSQYWAFEEGTDGTYTLRNLAKNKYLVHNSKSNTAWTVGDKGTEFTVGVQSPATANQSARYYVSYDPSNTYACMHDANWGSGYSYRQLVGWEAGAAASQWILTKTDISVKTQPLSVVYSFTYGGVEKYKQTEVALVGDNYPGLSIVLPFGVSAEMPTGIIAAEDVKEGIVNKEIVLSVNLPFNYADSYEAAEKDWNWYYLQFHANSKNYLYYDASKTYLDASKTTIDEENEDAYTWAFVGNPFDGFKVVNRLAGKEMQLNASADGAVLGSAGHVFVLTSSSFAENGFFMASVNGDKKDRFNKQNDKVVYWSGADTGSTFMIERRPTDAERLAVAVEKAQALLDANANNHAVAPALRQYSTAGYEAFAAAIQDKNATSKSVETAILEFEKSKNLPLFTIDSQKDYALGQSIYENEEGALKFKATDAIDKTMLWAFDMAATEVGVTDKVVVRNAATGKLFWGASFISVIETEPAVEDDGVFMFKTEGTGNPIHAQASGSSIVRWSSADANAVGGASTWKFAFVGVSNPAAYDLSEVAEQFKAQAAAFGALQENAALSALPAVQEKWVEAMGVVEPLYTQVSGNELVLKADVVAAMATMKEIQAVVTYYSETFAAAKDEANAAMDELDKESEEYKALLGAINVSTVTTVTELEAKAEIIAEVLEYLASLPEVDPNDYTSYIKNAAVTSLDEWTVEGNDISHGDGLVKLKSNFDFNQTITLPAGKYKMTVKAAYRYAGGSVNVAEKAEYDAIQAGVNTHLAKVYAQTATCKYEGDVQNRWEGRSETDLYGNLEKVSVIEHEGVTYYVPNSSAAVMAWFNADKYVNELVFNVQAEGEVKIGMNKTETAPNGEYTNISAWTLTRLGDAEADPNDYTSHIKNAAVTSAEGWNIGAGKHEGGLMKYGSGKLVDFNQTITLPAGQYKMTAKAAYRYTGGEQSEYEAIQAGTNTHLAKLYAETATYKYEGNVMNRYEGASDTDYAAGSGSVTVNGKFVPNSSSAVLKWFEAGQYVNEIVFNVQADGEVKIGIETKETVPGGEYTNISAWTLTRLGDAEADPKEEEPDPEDPSEEAWGPSTVGNGKFYLYNVGAQGYLFPANNHAVHASVTKHGGILVELQGSDNVYTISTNETNAGKFMNDGGWMDGDAYGWTFELVSEGVYKLKSGENVLYWNGEGSTNTTTGADPGTDAAHWMLITEGARRAGLAEATAQNPVDATFFIKNPNISWGNGKYVGGHKDFDLSNSPSWKGTKLTDVWGPDANNEEANIAIEQYGKVFDNYQELKNIPNGLYHLTAKGFYRGNVAPYVYANDKKCELKVKGDIGGDNLWNAGAALRGDDYLLEGVDVLVTDGALRVGVKSDEQIEWCVFDEFRLSYYGEAEDPEAAALAQKKEAFLARAEKFRTFVDNNVDWSLTVINQTYLYPVSDEVLGDASLGVVGLVDKMDEVTDVAVLDHWMAEMDKAEAVLTEAAAAAAEFAKWQALIQHAAGFAATYDEATAEAAMMYMEFSVGYNCATVEAIETATDEAATAYKNFVLGATPVKDEKFDLTFAIVNPNFEADVEGWTCKEAKWNNGRGYNDVSGIAEIANWNASSWEASMSQTLNNLPNGKYIVKMAWMAANGIKMTIAANESSVEVVGIGDQGGNIAKDGTVVEMGQGFRGWQYAEVEALVEDGTLAIAVNSAANAEHMWSNADAFELYYAGAAEVEPEYLTVVGAKVGDVAIVEGKATVESISSFEITFDRPVALAEDAEWAQLTDKWGDNSLKAEVLEDNNSVVRFSLQWGQEFTEAGDFYLYIPEGVVVDAENVNCINAAIEAVITVEGGSVEPATPLAVVNVTVGEDVMSDLSAIVATTEDMIKVNFDGKFYFQGEPSIVDAEGNDASSSFEYMNGLDVDGSNSYIFMGKKEGTYTITLAKAQFNELEMMGWKAPAEDIVLTVTISVPDGIQNINADADAVIYDIHGRRVEKMTKGLYIVNGRKVMVK